MTSSQLPRNLLLAGASVRAAAQSAARAGFRVVAIDLFADADLRAIAQVVPVSSVAGQLGQVARRLPPGCWMYTGALENAPTLVDRVSQRHRLCGNDGNTLRAVRDPRRVARALAAEGLKYPDFHLGSSAPAPGAWLSKPLRSSAGTGVFAWRRDWMPSGHSKGRRYLQRRIEGELCSAMFVAAGGDTRNLGVSRQLVGCPWCGARGFQYAGSVGPISVPSWVLQQFGSIATCLARRFRLTGLFGVDAVVDEQYVWTLEVNPRYCASVEVLERGWQENFVAAHLAACSGGQLPEPLQRQPAALAGKAVVFARQNTAITEACLERLMELVPEGEGSVRVADVPFRATRVQKGHPLLTVFALGQDEHEVLAELQQNAQRIYQIVSDPSL